MNSQRIMGMKFNGTAIPDAGLAATIAGEFGVPTVSVRGPESWQDMKRLLAPIETVAIKQAIGFYAGTVIRKAHNI